MSGWRLLLWLVPLALASLAWALLAGSLDLAPGRVWAVLTGHGDALARTLVLELRWPRAAAGFVTGGLLALAGSLLQVLLRNPLADPYVLGTSGGAAVGTLAVLLLGLATPGPQLAAFGGALLSNVLVFALARSGSQWSSTRALLTGVVLASGWGALIAFLLSLGPDRHLRGMLFWLMGDIGPSPWTGAAAWGLLGCLLPAWWLAPSLNVLVRGERVAASLGVAPARVRNSLFLLGSLATALAVGLAGSIGFVGLVVPHSLRLLGARDHRLLLPAAVLLGGSLVVAADTLARTLLAPRQLPVGVLTAALGVPFFLWLLRRSTGETGR